MVTPWINYPFAESAFCSCGHEVSAHVGGKCSVCACVTCEQIPVRDWQVTRIDRAGAVFGYGLVIEGINRNSPPGGYGRRFTWYFTGPHADNFDRRYDCSNAEITPAAAAFMCERNGKTLIHY